MTTDRFEVQRTIPADAATIFSVVSSPEGHVAIDASGMLQSATGVPAEAVGDTFVIHMDRESLGDIDLGKYDVIVTFTAFEQDRYLTWEVSGGDAPSPMVSPSSASTMAARPRSNATSPGWRPSDPADDGADEADGGDPCGTLDAPLECEWETAGGVDLQLRMVDIGALPAECPALESPVYEISELPDLGDSAWWEWDALEGEGAVRVCTPQGMAESRVESPDDGPLDEDTVMAAAIALVTPAVDAL